MNEKPDKPPWSPRLELWLREFWNEAGSSGDPSDYSRDFATLPKRLVELIGSLNKEKNTISALSGRLPSGRRWPKPENG